MNATDQISLAVLQKIAVDGVAAISTRRLAEEIGRSRATAAASLQRHIRRGDIGQISGGRGIGMGRYRVPSEEAQNLCISKTTMTSSTDVPDVFRSPSLYGAGRLHAAAPKGELLTISEIIGLEVTRSRRGVNEQLSKLESLSVPLAVSHSDPSHKQRKLWVFIELTAEDELTILHHMELLAPQYQPRNRLDQEAQHLHEQEMFRCHLGLEPYSVIADSDIFPNVIEDPFTGCLLFEGSQNNSGYGVVVADHLGIGVHRIVWIAERGPVPAGSELHHPCMQRNCVNIHHLQVVTKAEHTRITWGMASQPASQLS